MKHWRKTLRERKHWNVFLKISKTLRQKMSLQIMIKKINFSLKKIIHRFWLEITSLLIRSNLHEYFIYVIRTFPLLPSKQNSHIKTYANMLICEYFQRKQQHGKSIQRNENVDYHKNTCISSRITIFHFQMKCHDNVHAMKSIKSGIFQSIKF